MRTLVFGCVIGGFSAFSGLAANAAPSAPPPVGEAPAEVAAAPEAAPAPEAPDAAYLAGLRARCEKRWTKTFVPMAASQLPKDHPINDQSRRVVLDITATPDGRATAVEVATSSGAKDFDASAVDIVKDSAPFGKAPEALWSDDGLVHVAWTFERAEGRCSDVAVVNKESPLEIAIPRLVDQGRDAEALRRLGVAASSGAGAESGLSAFAKAWLARAAKDRRADVTVFAALARTGDKGAVERLKKVGPSAGMVASAMARAGVDLCPLVKDKIRGAASDMAIAVLGAGLSDDCVAPVAEVAANRGVPPAARAAALRALATNLGDAARRAVWANIEDPSPVVKAAAVAAGGRPGAGKPTLFRLVPYLRDPAVEVRAEASAAIVRAVGDAALEQLYLIWKETDPRVYELVAAELGTLSSKESADMLARFLKKAEPRVRTAAAEALAMRKDAAARAVLASVAKDADPTLRAFALPLLASGEREAVVAGVPGAWRAYRAHLRAGDRDAAGTWLLAHIATMKPADRAVAFSEWLGDSSPKMTARR